MSEIVDTKTIERLLKESKPGSWTNKELESLKKMKEAGIAPATIIKHNEIIDEYFPGRSDIAIKTQYGRIKIGQKNKRS